MAESIVTDWLADYAAIEKSEIRTFAAQHEHNHDISNALFTIINERLKYPDLLHSICDQLFSYYRSNVPELRRFTLQFIPTLIYTYLNAVAQGDKKSCRCIETFLLGMYNIEVSHEDGRSKVVSFRMPVLAQASIYHEEKALNASDLRRWEENSNKVVNWGPLPQIEAVNAQNRLKIMTALMFIYNQQLGLIPKPALYHLCRVASQLANQGFPKHGHAHRSSYGSDPSASLPKPRIPMSSNFLLELLHATYFAMFNEFGSIAIQTVDDIHNRACYELYPETILVTNAIKNSLHVNPSGQPSDGPMGISVALTPSTHTVTVSKSMITNASFRTKKLPDDIPIQATDEANSSSQLVSISEETEADPQIGSRNALIRSSKEILKTHKVPFPGFKKNKDKDKDKDKEKDKDIKEKEKDGILSKSSGVKNGNLFGDNKDSTTSNSKQTKKDKRASLQSSVDAIDLSLADKTSPIPNIKRKSSSVDAVSSNIGDGIQLQSFANGSVIVEEKSEIDYTTDGNGLSDTTNTDGNGVSQRSSIILDHNTKIQNNMQISQV